MTEEVSPVLTYIDLETTVRSPISNNKAHPCWVGNEIVTMSFKLEDGRGHFFYSGRDPLRKIQ